MENCKVLSDTIQESLNIDSVLVHVCCIYGYIFTELYSLVVL